MTDDTTKTSGAPEETSRAEQSAKRRVRLDRPGLIACGPYQAGQVYEVDAEEAERLISVKGFTDVDKAEESAKD